MKILENLRPVQENTDIETSKLMSFSGYYCDLLEYNLESRSGTTHPIFIPGWELGNAICMCLLPDNKLFCCGSEDWESIGDLLFIIDEKYEVKTLPSQITYIECSATYYKNSAYICGDGFIDRFDLIKWRWERLINLQDSSKSYTLIPFNDMILVSGRDYSHIFVLDLLTLSLSSCQLELEKNWTKILYERENSAYLIDFSGKIIKSDNGNPFNWNIIGNFSPFESVVYGYKALYKDSFYFHGGPIILKFDLNKKIFEEIRR